MEMKKGWRGSLKGILSLWELLFPRRCKACGLPLLTAEHTLCTYCAVHFPLTGFALQEKNPIVRIFYGRVKIQFASALFFFEKGRPYQQVIHAIKYKGDVKLAYHMGLRLGESIKGSPFYESIDAIVPVPLHPGKFKKRGYNQSEEIAKGACEVLDIKLMDLLVRVEQSDSQTKKAKNQRTKNVAHAFEINSNDRLLINQNREAPLRILIIDDVITTGATLQACAKLLQERGCLVYIASLAYAL